MEFRFDPPSITGIPMPSTVFRCCETVWLGPDLSCRAADSWATLGPEFRDVRDGAWNDVDDDLRKNGNEVVVPRLDVLDPAEVGTA